jgi:AcrR family transcriptional regulator
MSEFTAKRNLILSTAIELFSKRGYVKTSLGDIAASVGMGKATLYYYFPSKEELFLQAVSEAAEEFFCHLRSNIARQSSFEDKLRDFLGLPVRFILENMPILAEAIRVIPTQFKEKLDDLRTQNRSRMYSALAEIIEHGKAQEVLAPDFASERFSQLINDWFLLTDTNFVLNEREHVLKRLENDLDWIVKLILYGILKRG